MTEPQRHSNIFYGQVLTQRALERIIEEQDLLPDGEGRRFSGKGG